ncbi:plasmid pRiA4b ORF-3 family protein [Romboutsia sp.]|uniref:plasmid pRiA4b ORF-3 family protein n=1 Tax=Romboutsia sp. TaxID=1965302 RepID=UPI003F2BB51F
MIINCTKKLQEELNIKPDLEKVLNSLFSWHGNIIRINRRKTLILTNDATRYTVVLYGLKAKDFKNIQNLIVEAIRKNFEIDCVNQEIILKYIEDIGEITFSTTQDRKQVARMNSAGKDVNHYSRMNSDDISPYQLSKISNNAPLNINGYAYPKELLYEELEKLYNMPPIRCKAVKIKARLDFEKMDISRELIVPLNYTFRDLHKVMQRAFQWHNGHLYEFTIIDKAKEMARIIGYEDEFADEYNIKTLNDAKVSLSEYLPKYKNIVYRYDFGDDWIHVISVEDILFDYDKYHAVCVDGNGDSPPEDIGGEWGYYEYLEILKDETHEDYEQIKNLSQSYHSGRFDIKSVNIMLK